MGLSPILLVMLLITKRVYVPSIRTIACCAVALVAFAVAYVNYRVLMQPSTAQFSRDIAQTGWTSYNGELARLFWGLWVAGVALLCAFKPSWLPMTLQGSARMLLAFFLPWFLITSAVYSPLWIVLLLATLASGLSTMRWVWSMAYLV